MLQQLIGHTIVIDTPYSIQYIGKLVRFNNEFIELHEVDVHDASTTKNTKEQYLMEAARGINNNNRKAVLVKQSTVISLSRLDDILVF